MSLDTSGSSELNNRIPVSVTSSYGDSSSFTQGTGVKRCQDACGHSPVSVPTMWVTRSSDLPGDKLRGGLAPWQIKRVSTHIDRNITEKVNVDELASLVKLSKSYFSKAFRNSFGLSPYNYVLARRIEIAMEMMLEVGMPLCQVALDTGWADQAHLSRVFRRMTGTTPSAWRAKHRRQ